jgi:hypothetical protein
MPTALKLLGFRFFFFSGEGSEPPHIHVELAESEGFRSHELARVRSLVIEHRAVFLEKWDEHFSNPT